jgi:hypothetical protein
MEKSSLIDIPELDQLINKELLSLHKSPTVAVLKKVFTDPKQLAGALTNLELRTIRSVQEGFLAGMQYGKGDTNDESN